MKRSFVFFIVVLLLSVLYFSCDSTKDEPEKDLIVSVDKSQITCDGNDKAQFIVMYGDQDVTTNSQICITDEMCLTMPVFVSENTGEYEFYATYKEGNKTLKSSNTVVVNVIDDFDYSKELHKNVSFFIWTATWCAPCYTLKASINIVMNEAKYRDHVSYVSFYTSENNSAGKSDDAVKSSLTEPFINQLADNGRFFIIGYPSSVIDFTTMEVGGLPVVKVRSVLDTYMPNSALTGIKVNSVIEDEKINVKVSVGAKEEGTYYIGVLLTEDNIRAFQNGSDENYIHNNVVRAIGNDDIFGEKLGDMSAGDVITKTYAFDVLPKYNSDNLNIMVYTLYDNKWGIRVMANSIKASANGFTNYRYAK